MTKKLTITISDEVYDGLHQRVGPRKISSLIDRLARQHLNVRNLKSEYAEAAQDEQAEADALEWIEANVDDCLPDEEFSDWPSYPSR